MVSTHTWTIRLAINLWDTEECLDVQCCRYWSLGTAMSIPRSCQLRLSQCNKSNAWEIIEDDKTGWINLKRSSALVREIHHLKHQKRLNGEKGREGLELKLMIRSGDIHGGCSINRTLSWRSFSDEFRMFRELSIVCICLLISPKVGIMLRLHKAEPPRKSRWKRPFDKDLLPYWSRCEERKQLKRKPNVFYDEWQAWVNGRPIERRYEDPDEYLGSYQMPLWFGKKTKSKRFAAKPPRRNFSA